MTPHYSKIHNKFRLNDMAYDRDDLREVAYSFVKEGDSHERSIGDFLLHWLDEKDHVEVMTSGSTGIAKTIHLRKQAMVNSAIATGDYFNLAPNNSALLCLSTDFIAGKMMIVRALILGLRLDVIAPTSEPLKNTTRNYDLCAMVPMQVERSLSALSQIGTLIIGGASISSGLIERLQDVDSNVYESYGMTETATHIALRHINRKSKGAKEDASSYFEVLPNISIRLDDRACLVIKAPSLFDGELITNDIVQIHSENKFEFLGRLDNMINSGGVKLFPEQIEATLSKHLSQRFFITSIEDAVLGEKVVLVLEGDADELPDEAFKYLKTYERPKTIYCIPKFIETLSGKIMRKETLHKILRTQ